MSGNVDNMQQKNREQYIRQVDTNLPDAKQKNTARETGTGWNGYEDVLTGQNKSTGRATGALSHTLQSNNTSLAMPIEINADTLKKLQQSENKEAMVRQLVLQAQDAATSGYGASYQKPSITYFKSKWNDGSARNKYAQEPYKHFFQKPSYNGLLTKHHNLKGLTDRGSLELNNGKDICLGAVANSKSNDQNSKTISSGEKSSNIVMDQKVLKQAKNIQTVSQKMKGKEVNLQRQTFRVVVGTAQMPNQGQDDHAGLDLTEPQSAITEAMRWTGPNSHKNNYQFRSGFRKISAKNSQGSRCSNADLGHLFQQNQNLDAKGGGQSSKGGGQSTGQFAQILNQASSGNQQQIKDFSQMCSQIIYPVRNAQFHQSSKTTYSHRISQDAGLAGSTVNTIPLININLDPKTDQRIADSQSTPHQISSPKFQHARNLSGHDSEMRDGTILKNRDYTSNLNTRGQTTNPSNLKIDQDVQAEYLALLQNDNAASFPSSGINSVPYSNRDQKQHKQCQVGKPILEYNQQNKSEAHLPGTASYNNNISTENHTLNVQADTQKSLLQTQIALEEADKNMDGMLGLQFKKQSELQVDPQCLSSGYDLAAQQAKIQMDIDKQADRYHTRFHEFQNFKREILKSQETSRQPEKLDNNLMADRQANGKELQTLRNHQWQQPLSPLHQQDFTKYSKLDISAKRGSIKDAAAGGFQIKRNLKQPYTQNISPSGRDKQLKADGKNNKNNKSKLLSKMQYRTIKHHQYQSHYDQAAIAQSEKQRLQAQKTQQLSDFVGCLKERDLEIISKITNADGLKNFAFTNAQNQSSIDKGLQSERTVASNKRNQRGAQQTIQKQNTTQDTTRESAKQNQQSTIYQNIADENTLSQLPVNAPIFLNQFDRTNQVDSPAAQTTGLNSYITSSRPDYILSVNMKSSQHESSNDQPKSDKKFVVQVPQTGVQQDRKQNNKTNRSTIQKKCSNIHQPVLLSNQNKNYQQMEAERNVQSSNDLEMNHSNEYYVNSLKQSEQQNIVTSSITLKRKDLKLCQFDETMMSCTTPQSNDTQYANNFNSNIRSSASQKRSVKQLKASGKYKFPQNLNIERIVTSPNSVDRKYGNNQNIDSNLKVDSGNSSVMQSKGTLGRDDIKLARDDIQKTESQNEISRSHLNRFCRISNSEQRQNFRVLGSKERSNTNKRSKKNSLIEMSQSQGGTKDDMSPLKNEKIARLSQQNSTNSLNQFVDTQQFDNFDKKILELSQENSQESNEKTNDKEEVRTEVSKNNTQYFFNKLKDENNKTTNFKQTEMTQKPQISSRRTNFSEANQTLGQQHQLVDSQLQNSSNQNQDQRLSQEPLKISEQNTTRQVQSDGQDQDGQSVRSHEKDDVVERLAPFSLDMLPSLDIITISPQNTMAPTNQFQDSNYYNDQKSIDIFRSGYRTSAPNEQFFGHGHAPIISSRGGIMTQECSDRKTCEVRSNKQDLSIPRISDAELIPPLFNPNFGRSKNVRGQTAGVPYRKTQHYGKHRHFYQSLLDNKSNFSSLKKMLEIKNSDYESMEPGNNKLTIVIDDPVAKQVKNSAHTTKQSFRNLNQNLKNFGKENQLPRTQVLQTIASDKSSQRGYGPQSTYTRSSQIETIKGRHTRRLTEVEKHRIRLERYHEHRNKVQIDRQKRAKMTQNRCLQRQRVQDKNKSIRIQSDYNFIAKQLKFQEPIKSFEPLEKELKATYANIIDLTQKIYPSEFQSTTVYDNHFIPSGQAESSNKGPFSSLPTNQFNIGQQPLIEELENIQRTITQEQLALKRNTKMTHSAQSQPDQLNPKSSYRKIASTKRPPIVQKMLSDKQAVLQVKLGHQPKVDLPSPVQTVRRRGTLHICTSEEIIQ